MQTKPLVSRSLEEGVYEAVRQAIVSGELAAGAPLVEVQLSEQFGVSKTPVREALIRLKRDGLVASAPHRMNRVATPTEADIRQACEVRMWIEAELAGQAAANPSQELLKRLRQSISDAEKALRKNDQAAYLDSIRSFSDVLVERSENAYAVEFLERLRDRLALIANVARRAPGRRKRSIEEHRAIYNAIREGDPAAAVAATRRHLESIEADSLDALERLEEEAA